MLENVNPDLSDSEYLEKENPAEPTTPGFIGSDAGDAPTPGHDHGDADDGADGDEGEGEGDIDEELAAELDLALGDEEADDEDGDEEEEESEEEDEDDDDEDDELSQARKLLHEEIRDLEAAVAKKGAEIASSANPLIKVCPFVHSVLRNSVLTIPQRRFEDALKKLQADLDMKLAQRDEMKEKQRMRKEGIVPEEGDTDGVNEVDGDDGDDEDDLFGDEPETAMDVD